MCAAVTGGQPLADHALVLTAGASSSPDPYVPDPTRLRWMRIGVPGHLGRGARSPIPEEVARIKLPAEFIHEVMAILEPAQTVFVTDAPLSPQTSGAAVQVVDADPAPAGRPAKL